MVAGIRKEISLGFIEVRRCAAILLCKNDFVEEFDLGILAGNALALMDELIESLGLLQCCQILHVFGWLVLHEIIHLELVVHARFLAVAMCRYKISSVSVQQAGKTSHERSADLVRSESRRADYADRRGASGVDVGSASYAGSDGSYIRGFLKLTRASIEPLI